MAALGRLGFPVPECLGAGMWPAAFLEVSSPARKADETAFLGDLSAVEIRSTAKSSGRKSGQAPFHSPPAAFPAASR